MSYRVNGFFGELYRIGASEPVEWIESDTGEVKRCRPSPNYIKCQKLKEQTAREMESLLKEYGYRMKFPAKSPDLSKRWCSGSLKAAVQNGVTSSFDIDYSEKDVWEVLKRNHVPPHPCYRIGWNRCSCAMCIFSTPSLFAGIREIYPKEYGQLKRDEKILGFTLDNKKYLDDFVGEAQSCVYWEDEAAVRSIRTGAFSVRDIYTEDWNIRQERFMGRKAASVKKSRRRILTIMERKYYVTDETAARQDIH